MATFQIGHAMIASIVFLSCLLATCKALDFNESAIQYTLHRLETLEKALDNQAVLQEKVERIEKLEKVVGNKVEVYEKLERLEKLEKVLGDQAEVHDKLKRLEKLEKMLVNQTALQDKLTTLETREELMLKRLEQVEQSNTTGVSRGRRAGQLIAFSAQLTGNHNGMAIGSDIIFDKEVTNDGYSYDSRTGIFTAPIAGVYFFIYHSATDWNVGQLWLCLMHDGNMVNSAASDAFHNNQDAQGSNSVIIFLSAGSRVWVETCHQDHAAIHGSRGFVTFSGMILY